jgi:2-polyprenyl-6-methoxyphenol hydroxylase-like FAD-dependent oxidoreductase
MSEIDVLVVGAGPTGLTLAAELTRQGLTCRIIDKLPLASDKSKALVVHARTLEVLDTLGIADELVECGERIEAINFMNRGKTLATINTTGLDSPYPFMLSIPQNETERVLTLHLVSLGLQIERQLELLEFQQDDNAVTATLQHPDGTKETVRSRWLVGCDGAHSTVRHHLNLSFDGFPYEDSFWLADVYVKWELPLHQIYNFLDDKSGFLAFPIQNNRYRLLSNTPLGEDQNIQPTLEAIQALASRACPFGVELYDPVWLANFKVHHRKVSSYRQGRIFLVGDAAHVHSPAGGQGMNTGIQDAHNLAWKLALVAKGQGQETLLDTYHSERNAVGEQVLKNTDRLLKMLTLHNPLARTLRDHALPVVSNQEGLTDRLKTSLSQLDIGYSDSPLTVGNTTGKTGIIAGERAPEALLSTGFKNSAVRLFELYRNGKFNLLLLTGTQTSQAEYEELLSIARSVETNYNGGVEVHLVVAGKVRPAALANWNGVILYDPALALHHRYGFNNSSAYLIRPDGYVGFSSQPASLSSLEDYLARFLVKQPALASRL